MLRCLIAGLMLATPALSAPKVATTIAPLTAVVRDLMHGIGAPTPLMPTNVGPHNFTVRPSQIIALREAELVFAVGFSLEHWLTRVDGDFTILNMTDNEELNLPARDFDMTLRTELDPHLWLDPLIMRSWVLEMSQALIRLDPENTATYRANEMALLKTLTLAGENMEKMGTRLRNAEVKLVVAHDAYQYLEHRLGVPAVGMFTDFNEAYAGARSLSRLSRLEGAVCLIDNPEIFMPEDLLPQAPHVFIDPIGVALAESDTFVASYYASLTDPLEGCLTQPEEP